MSDEARAIFEQAVEASISSWLAPGTPFFAWTRQLALGRLTEGIEVARFLRARLAAGPARVLDVGSGNGGVSLGLAVEGGFRVTALDLVANPVLRRVRGSLETDIEQVVGRGEFLPFADRTFDVVLCLDSFEHFTEPGRIGAEIMRVLAPGGLCLLKTPARIKYLFRPDPHCGLRGLLLLPDGVQRFLVNHILRWPVFYDVHHTYWHVGELLQHFPGRAQVELLWDRLFPGTRWLHDRLWYRHRFFHWDGIVIRKAALETEPPADRWSRLPFPLAQVAEWDRELP